jgi:hypothetical protein
MQIFVRAKREIFEAVAPRRRHYDEWQHRARGYGITREAAVLNLFSFWRDVSAVSPGWAPRYPARIDDRTISRPSTFKRLEISLRTENLAPGLRTRELLSVGITRLGAVRVSVRRWKRCTFQVRNGRRVTVEWPYHLILAETTIPSSAARRLWQYRDSAREAAITAIALEAIRSVMAKESPALSAFGQIVRHTPAGLQVTIVVPNDRLVGPALFVEYRAGQATRISSFSYRIRESTVTPGQALIVPRIGALSTEARIGMNWGVLENLSPTAQAQYCQDYFWRVVNPSLENPYVYAGHPALKSPREELDQDPTEQLKAALSNLVAASESCPDHVVRIYSNITFDPDPRAEIIGYPTQLSRLKGEMAAAIQDVILQLDPKPAGTFVHRGRQQKIMRMSDWVPLLRLPDIEIGPFSAHDRILARRRTP